MSGSSLLAADEFNRLLKVLKASHKAETLRSLRFAALLLRRRWSRAGRIFAFAPFSVLCGLTFLGEWSCETLLLGVGAALFVAAEGIGSAALGARLYREGLRFTRDGDVLRVGVTVSPVFSSSALWNSASSVLVNVFLNGGAEIGVWTRTGLSQGLSKRCVEFAMRL